MNENIDNAIKILTKNIDEDTTPEEALKYTQAALNLAHTKSILFNTPILRQ